MAITTFFKAITHHEKQILALEALWRASLSQGTYASDWNSYVRFQATLLTSSYHANIIPMLIFSPSLMKHTLKSQASQQKIQSFFINTSTCKHMYNKYLKMALENPNPMSM